ncbi:MAG: L-serine ammonia-lyase, iron-sulfur-dependent, subunit alpha [Desulfovibrio sp.]|nr:L-serine ammonia-lyase, iron-sulfur-dependent, subunit alpha [Desulfovibrio sp.]
MSYSSLAELVVAATEAKSSIARVALRDQAEQIGLGQEQVYARMRDNLLVMREAAIRGLTGELHSPSGLSGGDGLKMERRAQHAPLSGVFCAKAIARALAIAEYNAAMGRIVAAPTAGSCGILPAALLTMIEETGASEESAVMALFTAGAVGLVIANVACISGAEGGCQAECGSAAAMTAAALVEMAEGAPQAAADAAAVALKNQMGLVCDPVAGLVETPCIKRNAGGVMCAIAAADMALAGIKSVIPADEVIEAMRAVGAAMPQSLRETARGGLAATPTGIALKQKIFG